MKMRISRFKRMIACLTVFCLIFTFTPVVSFASEATDISGHWAKDMVQRWIEQGLVKGYEDETFRPDNNITRAEFMSLVNGAFGFSNASETSYSDVSADAWYQHTVAVAKAASYISGYPDNTMRPNNPISRAEAASIIMKINHLGADSSGTVRFIDESGFGWSKDAISAVSAANIMNGYPDGSFQPQKFIKRAEAVAALDKALAYSKKNITYSTAGTYGTADGIIETEGSVTVDAKDIILQNMKIKGDLVITKNVGAGDVTLNNVTVEGETIINGGGENSILVIDSTLGNVTVSKEDGKIRILVSGDTSVDLVQALSGVKLEEKDLSNGSDGFREIILDASEDDTIILIGTFDKVTAASDDLNIKVPKGTSIGTFIIDRKADITGAGTIDTAYVNANEVTFETAPKKMKLKEGISEPQVGQQSSGGGGGGGGGGSPSDSKTDVSAVSVSGTPLVGQVLVANLTPAGATVTYQWTRSDTADGNDKIDGATNQSYTLTDADLDKYIKVTIKGTGSYTGTKTSSAVLVRSAVKEITGFTELQSVELEADEHLTDLASLKASGKLPATVTVTDGATPVNASITDWTGAFDGTAIGDEALTAVWTMPSGYVDAIDPIVVTIVVGVQTAQTIEENKVAKPELTLSKTAAENREAGVAFTVMETAGVTYYYTLDGSTPSASSTEYNDTVTLTAPDQDAEATVTIRVIGIMAGATDSEVAEATVTYAAKQQVTQPELTLSKTAAENREAGVAFTVTETAGVTYYYTLDGTTPTTSSSAYNGQVMVDAPDQDAEATVTIRVIGIMDGATDSEVAEATVTYAAKPQVAQPEINLSKTAAENREAGITFTVTGTTDATYYYTLDGSTPTASSLEYTDTVTLAAPNEDAESTITIKVIGMKDGSLDSNVAEATVIYAAKAQVALPSITLSKTAAENREAGVTFTVTGTTDVTYYYTLDGSTPSASSTEYNGTVTLTAPDQNEEATITIRVIGIKEGSLDSIVAEATVTYAAKQQVALPSITLSKTAAENREAGVTFTVTGTTDVTYYYTLDGTTPNASSLEYTDTVTLAAPNEDAESTVTIRVTGIKEGLLDSEEAEATVTYAARQQVAQPTITLSKTAAENREAGITFTVDGSIAGVTYYYTLDGSTPTASSSVYNGQVVLDAPDQDAEATVTIRVIGIMAGATDSEVAEATVTYAATSGQEPVKVIFSSAVALGDYYPSMGYSLEDVNLIDEVLWGEAPELTMETDSGDLVIKQVFSTSNGGSTLTINADNVTQSFLDWLEHDLDTGGKKAMEVEFSDPSAATFNDSNDENIINGSEGTPFFWLFVDYPDWEGTTIRINFHDLREGTNSGSIRLSDGTTASFEVITIGSLEPVSSINVTSENSVTTITEDDGELQLSAEVLPDDAYDQTIRWSVVNGTGYAAISNTGNGTTGRLYAGKDGTVDVYATSAADGEIISDPFTVTISGQRGPAAPTGIGTVGETVKGENDGMLTGVAPGQEYQLAGESEWSSITGSTVTGLAPGSYVVRVAETFRQPAGDQTVPLIIAEGVEAEEPEEPDEPETTESTVTRDPGNTGGDNAAFDEETFTFSGTIDYYEADSSVGRTVAGNYVGIQITAPEDISVDEENATFTYTSASGDERTLTNGTTTWMDGDYYVYYYPLVTEEDQVFTIVVDWDGSGTAYAPETIVISVEDAVLSPAEEELPDSDDDSGGSSGGGGASAPGGPTTVPVETVSIVTRDPGDTGGADLEFDDDTYTFSGTIDYYEADSSEGRTVAGNYVGVRITAPDDVVVAEEDATFTYTDAAGNEKTLTNSLTEWMDGAYFVHYYPLVTEEDQTFTVIIDWDGSGNAYVPETIRIKVDDAVLMPAPEEEEDFLRAEFTSSNENDDSDNSPDKSLDKNEPDTPDIDERDVITNPDFE